MKMKTTFTYQGWNIVKISALAIATILALILLVQGVNESGMRVAIRLTARTSCLLFLSAFIASTLSRIKSNQLTTWLIKNRRYLGVSFAVSHGYHALAIIGLVMVTSGEAYQHDHGGTLGYIFIIAMTATSFRAVATLLSPQVWKILHTVGLYYLWLAFTYSFANKLTTSWVIYLPFVSLLVVAMILRLITLKRSKNKGLMQG